MRSDALPVIVGAGPAGMRAAITLAAAGVQVVVLDEAAAPGGQIFRTPPSAIRRAQSELYGAQGKRAVALKAAFAAACSRGVDYRPLSLVWSAEGNELLTTSKESGTAHIRWTHLILATGAMDRILPVRGWTLPGIYSLGGAQTALKAQGCVIAQRVVFLGTGPLLYLVAHQYAKAGAEVVAVLDTAPAGVSSSAWLGLLSGGRTLLQGMRYVAALRLRRVPLFAGITPIKCARRVDGDLDVIFRDRKGVSRTLTCGGVGMGFGLKAETQLADLLGLDFAYDRQHQQWLPVVDAERRSSHAAIYLAGDGTAPQGAMLAEASGELAARTLLHDLRRCPEDKRRHQLMRALSRAQRFRRVLDEQLFPLPQRLAAEAGDDVVVCRCEGITAGTIRRAVAETGVSEVNRLKAFTRLGMGRCQGRLCGSPASEILAAACHRPVAAVGRLRGQAPVKPVPLAVLAEVAG
jgi:hydrogen cyanide synthase HcnB